MAHSCKLVTYNSTIFTMKKDIVAQGDLPIHPELKNQLETWLQNHYINTQAKQSITI